MRNPCNVLGRWYEAEARATSMCQEAQQKNISAAEVLTMVGLVSSETDTWESAHAKLAWHFAEGIE